jgi:hypothetical protein
MTEDQPREVVAELATAMGLCIQPAEPPVDAALSCPTTGAAPPSPAPPVTRSRPPPGPVELPALLQGSAAAPGGGAALTAAQWREYNERLMALLLAARRATGERHKALVGLLDNAWRAWWEPGRGWGRLMLEMLRQQ